MKKKWLTGERVWFVWPDGTVRPTPVIKGGTAPVWNQEDFRFRNNDGNLATATWMSPGNNVDQIIAVDTTFRLRIVVQVTNAKAVNNQVFELWGSYQGGAYSKITTGSSNVILVDENQGIADHATTQQRIGDGAYVAGDSEGYDDGTTDDDTGNVDFAGQDEVELEFALQLVGADMDDGETMDFNVYLSGGTQITASDPPRATASEAGAARVPRNPAAIYQTPAII